MRTFERDFVSLVAVVNVNHVALLRKFDTLFVRKLVKAPEQDAQAVRPTVIKAESAALLGDVLNIHISRPTQSLDRLVQDGSSPAGVLLVHGYGLGRWRHFGLRQGSGRQQKNRQKKLHHSEKLDARK